SLTPAVLDDHGAALDPAELAQPLDKRVDPCALRDRPAAAKIADGSQLRGLLRARRDRPRGRRAAQERDAVAPSHDKIARRGQSLAKGNVVRHSKIARANDAVGHERQIDRPATWAAFPLRPRKRRSAIKMQICCLVPKADKRTAAKVPLLPHDAASRHLTASAPACAILASSFENTPDTPMPPTTLPSTTTGTI